MRRLQVGNSPTGGGDIRLFWQEAELWQPKVETTEEGEGSETGALEEEEVRYKDYKEDGDEGTKTSREEIDILNEDVERDKNVSSGDDDVDRDAVQVGGGSEEDKWESGGSDGDEDKELLEAEEGGGGREE